MRAGPTNSCIAVFLVLLTAGSAAAELYIDREPPLSWDELVRCELVVLATYVSHDDKSLTLEVVESLKGPAKPGSRLTVKLEHLYSVEIGPTGWERRLNPAPAAEKIPSVCYKQQIINPGDPVPVSLRRDARQPAIYFFPDAAQPSLRRRRQLQSPLTQQGWQQALRGQPIDLLFRLIQDVDGQRGRDALEELGQSRDARCLEQLFAWVQRPEREGPYGAARPERLLSRLGDRNGDVYDRARKLLVAEAPGTSDYRFYVLAKVMAAADPPRALTDLPVLQQPGSPLAVRKAAVAALGQLPERRSAELALASLADPAVAESAWSALRALREGEDGYLFPRHAGLPEEAWLLERLRTAVAGNGVPAKVREEIRNYLKYVPRDTAEVDVQELRRQLLDPQNPTYHGRADGKTSELLKQAREACDPRVVLVLTEVLANVPEASGNRAYAFGETLAFFATLCPRAMHKDLELRGLPARFSAVPVSERSWQIRKAFEAAGVWQPRDPAATDELAARCHELSREVRDGKVEQTAELIGIADQLLARRNYSGLSALLDSASPAARKHFDACLQIVRQGRINSVSHERTLSDYSQVLAGLYPQHSAFFVQKVRELLQSDVLVERTAGVDALVSALQWDFDFDIEALQPARQKQLERIEPLLARVSTATETEARLILLEQGGVKLSGQPSDLWLSALLEAAGTKGPAAPSALRLIEQLTSERRARKFAHFPPAQRKRAVRAYLLDAGKLAAP